MRKMFLFILVVLIFLLAACGGSVSNDTEELTACEVAFQQAAEVSDMEDTVDDLNQAFVDCQTEEEFIAASDKFPGALDGVDPVTFMNNRCEFGPFNKQNSLCAKR